MKKQLSILIVVVLILAVFSSCSESTFRANDVSVSVKSNGFSYANSKQDCMGIEMQVIDESLYLYMPRQDAYLEPSVFVFGKNSVSKMENVLITNRFKTLWNDHLRGFGNGYMYIERYPGKATEIHYPKKAELICYDLVTGEMSTLLSTEDASSLNTAFDENGGFYCSIRENNSGKEKRYQGIQGNRLMEQMVKKPDLRSGTVSEVLKAYNEHTQMLSDRQLDCALDTFEAFGINSECILYPCSSGWLVYLNHNTMPLCLVSSDGSVSKVFEIECFASICSFNIYGNQSYFSFRRYEKWDDSMQYYLEPYENDTISGTYRIDLTDFSTTKISDNSYRGLFIFDDSSVFAVDKDYGVYQLDANGNLMNTLVNPR